MSLAYFEVRCPRDNKKLAMMGRPPLPNLCYTHLCDCGSRVQAQVGLRGGLIYASGVCGCGRDFWVPLGHAVEIKCRRCRQVVVV